MGRYHFIAAEKATKTWPVTLMCQAMQVSTSAFYGWLSDPTRGPRGDSVLRVQIRAIHRRSRETYGSPRVHAELRDLGFLVSRKRVARIMKEEGISGLPAKKKFKVGTTDSDHAYPVAPNLLGRQFDVEQPNKVWVGDITYLRTSHGFAYFAVVIDLYSRRVVGWAIGDHMRTSLVLEALNRAVTLRNPARGLVHHSDRGSQYASGDYRSRLESIGAVASMSRKGDCWDNAVAESFFGTLEQELAGRAPDWADAEDAKTAVVDYITTFYNRTRKHSTLSNVSPTQFEASQAAILLAAA